MIDVSIKLKGREQVYTGMDQTGVSNGVYFVMWREDGIQYKHIYPLNIILDIEETTPIK